MKIRHWAHWALGGCIPITFFLHPSVPWLLFTGYIIYQVKQDRDNLIKGVRKPDSHLDIYEMITPMSIVFCVLAVLKLAGII